VISPQISQIYADFFSTEKLPVVRLNL